MGPQRTKATCKESNAPSTRRRDHYHFYLGLALEVAFEVAAWKEIDNLGAQGHRRAYGDRAGRGRRRAGGRRCRWRGRRGPRPPARARAPPPPPGPPPPPAAPGSRRGGASASQSSLGDLQETWHAPPLTTMRGPPPPKKWVRRTAEVCKPHSSGDNTKRAGRRRGKGGVRGQVWLAEVGGVGGGEGESKQSTPHRRLTQPPPTRSRKTQQSTNDPPPPHAARHKAHSIPCTGQDWKSANEL